MRHARRNRARAYFGADCRALALAAGNAANPAIRQVATIGGNLCAVKFAAADLVPALLCLDAEIELHGPGGAEQIPLSRFLEIRTSLAPGRLVRRVIVRRTPRRSVHVRLPLRKAGDYPVAIFSLAVTLDAAGVVTSASAPSDRSGSGTALARIGSRIDRPSARSGACGRKSGAPLRNLARPRRCRGAGMVSPESSSQSRAQSRKRVCANSRERRNPDEHAMSVRLKINGEDRVSAAIP